MASDMAGPTKERLGNYQLWEDWELCGGGGDARAEEDHLEEDAAPEFSECRGAEVGVVDFDGLAPLEFDRGLAGGVDFGGGGFDI